MYLPAGFREDDVPTLHQAMRQATLVTFGPEGLSASHIPMLLPEPEPFGTLLSHVARANQQWHSFDSDGQALAIFLGSDAYVSPAWYATKRQTGKVVPTWNYVAIHAYGTLRPFHDPDRLLDLVTKLTVRQESGRPDPWAVSDAPLDFVRSQLKAIVGLELRIERLEGTWKMSQNRPVEDHAGIVDGLAQAGNTAAGKLVAERNRRPARKS